MILIRYPPCHSYIQSSLVKVLAVIEERKKNRKKENIHYYFRYGYFVTVKQIVMTTVEFL